MKFEFKLPDVGEGIHEAELISWCVAPGDRIKEGDDVAVMSTDKVTVDLPSPRSGTVVSLHGKPGDVITVSTVLMVIEVDAASAAAATDGSARERSAPAVAAPARHTAEPAAPGGAVVAGPSVRHLARQSGVDLQRLVGSGPGGRILRADVEAAASASSPKSGSEAAAKQAPRPPAEAAAGGVRRERLSGARRVAAKNLHESVQRTVTTTSSFELPGDGLRRLLDALAKDAQRQQLKLSPLHLIAKCLAAALVQHERFNATIDEASQEILLHPTVDLGIAVAAGDGLVVPVVRGVERRPLFDFVRDLDDLSRRAREGQLRLAELSGGSFTLSSTGGMEQVTMISTRPIINPPQTATLWVSRINERPRVMAGVLSAGPMLSCSLSFDHRYIDGAEAARFINEFGAYIEHPERALA